jgi:hypothetical protein
MNTLIKKEATSANSKKKQIQFLMKGLAKVQNNSIKNFNLSPYF